MGATAPLAFELIAGGRSNLTFRVTDATGTAFALRRPPDEPRPAHRPRHGARAHRDLGALSRSAYRSPEPLGLCTDEAVNERPFYVMEFVEGAILRDRAEAEAAFDLGYAP